MPAGDEGSRAALWRISAGALLSLLLALGVVHYLLQQREAELRDAEREARKLSLILATAVDASFKSVEVLQSSVLEWMYKQNLNRSGIYSEAMSSRLSHDILRDRVAVLPQVRHVFLTDLKGQVVSSSLAWPLPNILVHDQEYFRAFAEDPLRQIYLGTPLRNASKGDWTLIVARRIKDADSNFLGIIVASVALKHFEEFFRSIAPSPDSSTVLVRHDGILLAQYPPLEAEVGGVIPISSMIRTLQSGERSTSLLTRGVDGTERVIGVQALESQPLAVLTTRAAGVVLASWRQDAKRLGFATLLFIGLILAGVLFVNHQARHQLVLRRLLAAKAAAEAELAGAREREAMARTLAEHEEMLRAVFETGSVGVAEIDVASAHFTRVNRRFCEMTGRSDVELLNGRGPADVIHSDDLDADLARWQRIDATDGPRDAEKRYSRPDGSVIWVRLSMAVSARDADGRATRCVTLVQDITESRTATERLRDSEAMLRLGLEVGHIGAYRCDLLGNGGIRCGAETRLLLGLPEGDDPVPTAVWTAAVVPEDRERMLTAIADALARQAPELSVEYRFRHPSTAEVRHAEARTRYTYDPQGRPLTSVGVIIDITERREAEALLHLSLEVGRIGSFRHDIVAGSVSVSAEARAMYGFLGSERSIGDEDWWAPILPDDRERLRAEVMRGMAAREAEGACEYRIRRPSDGELRHVEARARYEYDGSGRPLSAVGVVIDVTERREAELRIAHLAHHDALTGLPNRVLFRDRLNDALARARRNEGFAVLYLDLDRFKEVNDTLGHPVGDALLRAVTARLQAELRETDTLARLGGDEFAVIQASLDQPRDATTLARRLVEVISAPFLLDGHQMVIGTSVGISLCPTDGFDPDALLKGADMALYRAKAEGRGRWRFFEPEMDARMQLRRTLELDLRRALAMSEFEVFYQPIVNIDTRRVSGLEALLRWRHPERGLVPPDDFIPLAEEIGLILPIGEWVLAQACCDAATWPGAPKVAVNLSPVQFAGRGLVEAVAAALAQSGLAPARLELEITETVLLQDTEATLATLHRLKALGVRIAMDDFGTGYSSLSYLQRFPFDKVKIDRSFTRELGNSRQSNAIVQAVTDLCAGLEMTTTAEGVETEAQLAVLRRRGCSEAQGYLFSKPKPAEEVRVVLQQLRQNALAE
ncbi:bifunctional diguanylate cyclase/phosphodiesterase [Paracraurococcus lichenis]|uniref:EAL domain-containing protein n=1 Tax=Paracraurococcus lichenis TaxID=3064888 RepID=A0ABT9EB01_9PROT|nr:EAL domain-containing protein [Paracraurococcus sp. LOR1-02]MDO9713387.1 EAL domain-containing protein [Paracraurococcus sp. LOR1-02]